MELCWSSLIAGAFQKRHFLGGGALHGVQAWQQLSRRGGQDAGRTSRRPAVQAAPAHKRTQPATLRLSCHSGCGGGGGASAADAAALAAPAAALAVWLAPQRHSSRIRADEQRNTEWRQRTRVGVAQQQVLHSSSSRCCGALAGRQLVKHSSGCRTAAARGSVQQQSTGMSACALLLSLQRLGCAALPYVRHAWHSAVRLWHAGRQEGSRAIALQHALSRAPRAPRQCYSPSAHFNLCCRYATFPTFLPAF